MATSNPSTGDAKIGEMPMSPRLAHPHSMFQVNQDYIMKTVKKKQNKRQTGEMVRQLTALPTRGPVFSLQHSQWVASSHLDLQLQEVRSPLLVSVDTTLRCPYPHIYRSTHIHIMY